MIEYTLEGWVWAKGSLFLWRQTFQSITKSAFHLVPCIAEVWRWAWVLFSPCPSLPSGSPSAKQLGRKDLSWKRRPSSWCRSVISSFSEFSGHDVTMWVMWWPLHTSPDPVCSRCWHMLGGWQLLLTPAGSLIAGQWLGSEGPTMKASGHSVCPHIFPAPGHKLGDGNGANILKPSTIKISHQLSNHLKGIIAMSQDEPG